MRERAGLEALTDIKTLAGWRMPPGIGLIGAQKRKMVAKEKPCGTYVNDCPHGFDVAMGASRVQGVAQPTLTTLSVETPKVFEAEVAFP
jgi:hypothetical protein